LFKLHNFCQLILWKIIKAVATKCHTSKLKCIKFDFGCAAPPHTCSYTKLGEGKGKEKEVKERAKRRKRERRKTKRERT